MCYEFTGTEWYDQSSSDWIWYLVRSPRLGGHWTPVAGLMGDTATLSFTDVGTQQLRPSTNGLKTSCSPGILLQAVSIKSGLISCVTWWTSANRFSAAPTIAELYSLCNASQHNKSCYGPCLSWLIQKGLSNFPSLLCFSFLFFSFLFFSFLSLHLLSRKYVKCTKISLLKIQNTVSVSAYFA